MVEFWRTGAPPPNASEVVDMCLRLFSVGKPWSQNSSYTSQSRNLPGDHQRRGHAVQRFTIQHLRPRLLRFAIPPARQAIPAVNPPSSWLFATAENRDRFQAEPERYAPQYGGYCAYAR